MTYNSLHISITIDQPADQVYSFASDPENLPKWASGLSSSIRNTGDTWIASSPMGEVSIRFADQNSYGVLDHEVVLPGGVKVYNPLRVFPNGEGSEVLFSLYMLPGRTQEEFNEDVKLVERDLKRLKDLVEAGGTN